MLSSESMITRQEQKKTEEEMRDSLKSALKIISFEDFFEISSFFADLEDSDLLESKLKELEKNFFEFLDKNDVVFNKIKEKMKILNKPEYPENKVKEILFLILWSIKKYKSGIASF